jgi:two-component system LytT family sensor kinase
MKKAIDTKRYIFYIWVALAWFGLRLLLGLQGDPNTYGARVVNELWRLVYITVLNVILFEVTLPFIKLRWKRILAGLVLLWIHLMLYSFGLHGWRLLGIALGIYTSLANYTIERALEVQTGYSAGAVFFFGIIKHIYGYYKLKQAAQQLRIEKQQAELNYLKSQTNPHFLFNTLNNIYSLARDKSDLAPESILRLSKILRYMLYEAGGAYIAIEEELKIISDYIALETLRYDESLRINFNHDIEDMKQALPPLLLIPLVENAFKHGVSETRDHPYVNIHITVKNRQLIFIVKNSMEYIPGQQPVKENIGLSNLRRQLQLLYTDYDLSLQPGEGAFTATLKINLASHV